MDFLNNISINSLNTSIDIIKNFGIIEYFFYLDELFDLNKFLKSIEIFNIKHNIPIKLIKKYEDFIFLNFEIYICIDDNIMALNCSHKFYDALSIFKILELIDNEYKNLNIDETIYLGDIFRINNFTYESVINNLSRKKFFIDFKIYDQFVFFKHATNNKSIEIINEIQELFTPFDILLVINNRKQLNIHENTIGCYLNVCYIKNYEKDFINKLKQNIITNFSIFDNKFIICNSYLKYKLPSFCFEQTHIYNNSDEFNFIYFIFITPKNKEGKSSIFMNKLLYNLLQQI